MVTRRQGFALGSVALVLAVIGACSDDRPPPASDSPGSVITPGDTATGDGGAGDGGGGADSGDGGEEEPACVGPPLGGSVVTARLLTEDLPGDSGGALTAGVYDLTDVAVYGIPAGDDGPAVPPDPVPAMQATLTLTADSFELTSQLTPSGAAPDPVQARRATYMTTDEFFLSLSEICPTTVTDLVPYSATPSTIVLHTGTRRWDTYTKR